MKSVAHKEFTFVIATQTAKRSSINKNCISILKNVYTDFMGTKWQGCRSPLPPVPAWSDWEGC